MDQAEQALRRLNQQTFDAEAREPGDGWRAFLEDVLAEDFVLRRARPGLPTESRRDMIERIASSGFKPPRRRVLPESVRVSTSGSVGVVESIVTLPDASGGEQAFQNVKVFSSSDGRWRCTYWQVSGLPSAPQRTAVARPSEPTADTEHFEGTVYTQELLTTQDDIRLLVVFFEPGARTRPHLHATDQILHVIEGEGVIASAPIEGGRSVLLPVRAGQVVRVPAQTWHWHGATHSSPMTHVAIRHRDDRDEWSSLAMLDYARPDPGALT
jgi:quercetin dioxygenase-like cupin family protein